MTIHLEGEMNYLCEDVLLKITKITRKHFLRTMNVLKKHFMQNHPTFVEIIQSGLKPQTDIVIPGGGAEKILNMLFV